MIEDRQVVWAERRERLAWARAWRREIATRHAELTRAVSEEIGKGVFECFVSEVVPLLRALRWLERHGAGVLRERRVAGGGVLSPGVVVRGRREPLGRVGIIATWNYPVGLLGVQMAQALVGGNRVVVKPSERSPRSQALLVEMARSAGDGRARGAIELLAPTRAEGSGLVRRAGEGEPDSTRIDHVVFTGSTGVGRQIALALAASLTTSTLELSGSDSAIVLADADVGLAARAIWGAVRLNGGQTCMGPRRVIVVGGVYEEFVSELGALAARTPDGVLVNEEESARAWSCVAGALAEGAHSVGREAAPPNGRTMRALAIAGARLDGALVRGEHFGPVIAVVRAIDEAHALRLHADVDRVLATSVFTRRARRARRSIAPVLGSTIVTINDCVVPTGHPAVGLGGRGPSGWGVSRGREGLLAMTRPVFVTQTARRVRMPTDLLEGKPAERFMRVVAAWLR